MGIEKIIKEFEKYSTLILEQLDLLEIFLKINEEAEREDILQKLTQNEETIDKYEVILDNHIIKTIVLYKPVATDLRKIFSIYRMVINLERIGDQIVKIAKVNNKVKDIDAYKKTSKMIKLMLKQTSEMVRKSLLSFVNNDKDLALWIKKDTDIDELNKKLLKKAIQKSELEKEVQALILNLSDIGVIISSIERIGDQATNIAEASIYSIIGAIVRHTDINNN